MNAIRIWAAAVCAAAIASSIAQIAVPDGKVQKAMRCVIGLFFVCGVIMPFAQGLPPMSSEKLQWEEAAFLEVTDDLSQELTNQTAKRFEENVRQIVQDMLSAQQIPAKKIEVDVHVGEDSSIYINSLKIQISKGEEENIEQISQIVQKETGITPEVWAEGEEVL